MESKKYYFKTRLKEYDLSSQWAILQHQKHIIKVDTKYLGDFKHIIGNYYSVLGEIHIDDSQDLVLNARLIRNVNGLDISLYEKILETRRKFLKKISNKSDVIL